MCKMRWNTYFKLAGLSCTNDSSGKNSAETTTSQPSSKSAQSKQRVKDRKIAWEGKNHGRHLRSVTKHEFQNS